MKITILQGAFLPVPPVMGGAVEKIWYKMGQEFVILGHQVTHISRSFEELKDDEVLDGVKYIRTSGFDTPKSLILMKFLDLIYTKKAIRKIPEDSDIIVTNTFWAPILIRGKMAKKVYVDVQRVPKGQMKFYKKAGMIRGNSSPIEKAIKNELPSIFHNKIDMVPNPLPFNAIDLKQEEYKKKIILYTGRLHPEKGLDLLIKAFDLIKKDWELRLVGPWDVKSGGGGGEYLESLKKMNKNKKIVFLGAIHDLDKLNKEYQQASIFVYPSIAEKGETFGLAPLEAMAWGCVPIVSNLDCFKDFIKDEENGLIFNHRDPDVYAKLASQINKLIENDDLRLELSKAASKVNETHSSTSIAKVFIHSFEKTLRNT